MKAPLYHLSYTVKIGGADGSRTRNLMIKNQLLYQLSYSTVFRRT